MVRVTKKNLSEFAHQKRARKNKRQLNPFEVHINRDKQKVLGQKNKNDRGLPGVSRAKAINRRKQSLLQEYKFKNKSNVFLDKRIGEKNSAMSIEDRALARFAMERVKVHRKRNIFSLNDDEVLTHRGQTLEEIEKFDDPKSDDEFSGDENRDGKLDKSFVEEAHFGGGVLSRPDSTLSRKDFIEQLIAESKKRKAEKQRIREQTMDLTEKLDSEWRDFLPLASASRRTNDDVIETPVKADSYDITVQELKFEVRGNPSEKLKSEEEIVREEKEKLETLEVDRLARMHGFVSRGDNIRKHRSADDLDDGFLIETVADDNDDSIANIIDDSNEDEEEDSDDDDKVDHDDETNDDISIAKERAREDIKVDKNTGRNQEEYLESKDKPDASRNEDSGDENSNDEDSEDSLLDLKASESSSEDGNKFVEKHVTFANVAENIKRTNQLDQACPKSILKESDTAHTQYSFDKDKRQEIEDDLERKKIMEKARKELPYTYSAPESFAELERLLENRNAEYQSIIVDRIIKCNHWTSNGRNKEKLSDLFIYLLQHVNNSASADNSNDLIECFQILDRLCPYLYDLAHMNVENAKNCVQEIIKEKHDEFEKNRRNYPDVDTLIFFKIVSLLFPTSDLRHPIVTPCLVFMSQILLKSRIKSRKDIARGLFICTLILEYTVLSKRYAPSVINFLRGIVYIAIPEVSTQKVKVIPPFKTTCNLLVVNETQIDIKIDPNDAHMVASDLIHEELDNEFRVKALLTAVNLIREFKNQLQELRAVYSIFEPILKLLKMNKFKKYPVNVRKHIKELRKELEHLRSKKLEHLMLEKKRPKPLRMYEPKIMTVYDGKRHKPMSKEKAEQEKLLHKYKKERKGAIREIRRDRAFLAKVQISQQIKGDAERKRKVKEIFGEAAMQQCELKKMKRKK